MAQRLRKAAGESNWRELKVIDRELAQQLLPKVSAWHTWTVRERAAYADLRRAHEQVREHCKREAALYAARLASMRETRIGWAEYALHSQDAGGAR
jgi:hypothetical protein